jgi:hypothetical protein
MLTSFSAALDRALGLRLARLQANCSLTGERAPESEGRRFGDRVWGLGGG